MPALRRRALRPALEQTFCSASCRSATRRVRDLEIRLAPPSSKLSYLASPRFSPEEQAGPRIALGLAVDDDAPAQPVAPEFPGGRGAGGLMGHQELVPNEFAVSTGAWTETWGSSAFDHFAAIRV
jgi:hypothetical protein